MKTNWQTKKFEDCLEKVVYTNKIQRKDFLKSGDFPVISQESEFVNGYWNNEADVFKTSTPIVIFGDHTQVLKYIDFDFVLGADGVKILQPRNFLDSKFFYYFLQSIDLKSLGYSRHYRLLKEFEIPLPPLEEQKRIVKILDEVFGGIEKAKENAEKNLKNSQELFESYLQNVFANPGKDWEEKKLGEVTTKIGSGATPRGGKESYKKEGIALVRSMNVHDRYFKEKNLAFIDDKQAKDLSNVTLQENDVLLNITGASVARSCIIPKEYLPARVNQHVSIIRSKDNIIDSAFLNFLLTSDSNKKRLLFTGEQGSTRQAITKVQLENFLINFPDSLSEQKAIVKKLDALSGETKKLEAIFRRKIADFDELKKSILKSAFAGKL